MISIFFKVSILLPRVRMIMIMGAFALRATLGIMIVVMMSMHVIHAQERPKAHPAKRHGRGRHTHLPSKVRGVGQHHAHEVHSHLGNGAQRALYGTHGIAKPLVDNILLDLEGAQIKGIKARAGQNDGTQENDYLPREWAIRLNERCRG